MKIAIMGAGLSGLCCAITLEKYGISPVIFEKRNQVGDRFVNGEAMLGVLSRPVNDSIKHLSDQHGIYLRPVTNIRQITFHSENDKAELRGNLGFTNIRGRHPDSYENQLSKQLKSQIIFNSKYTYEALSKDFTHVILATGDGSYTEKIQQYSTDLAFTVRGASVEGKFEVNHIQSWLDNSFTPKGFSFLIPYNEREASMAMGFPDYAENIVSNPEELWKRFYDRVCKGLGQNLKITDTFDIHGYMMGKCSSPRIGNTFFTGNCLCGFMPAFGFGQLPSMLSGIYAALDICGQGEYEKLTKDLFQSYDNSLTIRRAMERLDNKELDSLMKTLNRPVVNSLFNNERFNLPRITSLFLKPWITIKGNTP